MPRPFAVIGFTVFFTLSILNQATTGATQAALAVFAAALVVTLLIKRIREAKVFTASMISAVLSCVLLLCSNSFVYQPIIYYAGKSCNLNAVITSEGTMNYGNYYYDAKVTEIDGQSADFPIRLTFSSPPEAEIYDFVSGDFKLYLPGSSSEEILSANKSKGIYVAAYPIDESYSVIENDSGYFVGRRISQFRTAIKDSVYRILPNEYGGLAVALILGDKSGISNETLSVFNEIGITHLICVSGLHLSLWSVLVLTIFRKTGLNEKVAAVISAFFVIFFMLVAGLTHSVVRAGVMMLVYLFSIIVMRKSDSLNSLGLAITVIALENPFSIGSVGLQLSVLSTLGLILYSQTLRPKISEMTEKVNNRFIKKSVNSIISVLSATGAATALTFPVTLQLYSSFNFAVFLSNFLCVSAAGICMVLCAIGAAFGALLPFVFNPFGFLGGILCKYLFAVSKIISKIDFLTFRIEQDKALILIAGVVLVAAFAVLLAYFGKPKPVVAVATCFTLFFGGLLAFSSSGRKETVIRVTDCGNGTAVFMSHEGKNILFGCGGTLYSGEYDILKSAEESGGIDGLIVPDDKEENSAHLINVLKCTRPDFIVSDTLPMGAEDLTAGSKVFKTDKIQFYENIKIKSFYYAEVFCTFAQTDDLSVLICYGPIEKIGELPTEFRNADVVISRSDYPDDLMNYNVKYTVVNAENTRGMTIQNELICKGMKCAATAECGDIIIRARDGDISTYRK